MIEQEPSILAKIRNWFFIHHFLATDISCSSRAPVGKDLPRRVCEGEKADIGFSRVDPLRGAGIASSVLIEGACLVREDSALRDNAEVDRTGTSVTVAKGSACDLYLTRELEAAPIVRAPTSPRVVDVFMAQHLDMAAGLHQQPEADARRLTGLRLLPGRFMLIQQAMGVPRSRGDAPANVLRAFVGDMRCRGLRGQCTDSPPHRWRFRRTTGHGRHHRINLSPSKAPRVSTECRLHELTAF